MLWIMKRTQSTVILVYNDNAQKRCIKTRDREVQKRKKEAKLVSEKNEEERN